MKMCWEKIKEEINFVIITAPPAIFKLGVESKDSRRVPDF
jgi:hypothetical protein